MNFRMNRLLNAYNLTGTGQRDVGEGSLQWELEGENWDEKIAAVIASLSEGYAEEKVESEKVGSRRKVLKGKDRRKNSPKRRKSGQGKERTQGCKKVK